MRITRKAFTLVEMLIVVVIIGILIAALVPRLQGAQARARDTARKADLNQLGTALSSYFNDNGSFTGGGCADNLKSALVPTYISSIPRDPQAGNTITFAEVGGSATCSTQGSYGALAVYRNGGQNAGLIMATNSETPGKASNFVLSTASNTKIMNKDGAAVFDASKCTGNDNTNLKCFSDVVEGSTVDSNICVGGVDLVPTANSAGCDTNQKGSAKIDNAMIYIESR